MRSERRATWAAGEDGLSFQLSLIEDDGLTIRIMTGVKFLLKVTLRRRDLAAEIYHIKEPQKVPVVLSPDEIKRILTMAPNLKARTMLTISYGCGLRAGEVTRLTVGTSTVRRTLSASSNRRAARIATSCCRRTCSRCCESGGPHARNDTTPRPSAAARPRKWSDAIASLTRSARLCFG
jgi:hypothetical protein